MIFISYSSKDEKITREIKSTLEGAGYDCWMAPESISAGEDYADAIPKGIDSCEAFLLVLSENSMKSRFVKKELDRAISKDKYVIPAKIGACKLTTGFEFLLSDTQIIDISSPFSQLLIALSGHVKPKKVNQASKTSNATRQQRSNTSKAFTDNDNVKKSKETLTFGDGAKFIGDVVNGQIGKYGTYYAANGDRYEGEFKSGTFHGKGTYYWSDGAIYKGDWVNGVMSGYGVKTWGPGPWEKDRYEGEYKDGHFCGQGTYYFGDGCKYVGNWVNDVREGYGIFTWGPGKWEKDRYEGEFKDGKFNGQGTYYFGDGRVWRGPWKDDTFIGKK